MHTPGPWFTQDTLISTNNGRPLARVNIDHENWEANARLMASSTELLDSALAARQFINNLPTFIKADRDLILNILDEAINKAKGF